MGTRCAIASSGRLDVEGPRLFIADIVKRIPKVRVEKRNTSTCSNFGSGSLSEVWTVLISSAACLFLLVFFWSSVSAYIHGC